MSFKDFIDSLISFGNDSVIPLLFAGSFVAFLYGVTQYFIFGGANEEKRAQGRMFIFWGLIALTLMLTTYGFVHIFLNTFGIAP